MAKDIGKYDCSTLIRTPCSWPVFCNLDWLGGRADGKRQPAFSPKLEFHLVCFILSCLFWGREIVSVDRPKDCREQFGRIIERSCSAMCLPRGSRIFTLWYFHFLKMSDSSIRSNDCFNFDCISKPYTPLTRFEFTRPSPFAETVIGQPERPCLLCGVFAIAQIQCLPVQVP